MRKSVFLAIFLPLMAGCGVVHSVIGPDDATVQREAAEQRVEHMSHDIADCTGKRKLGQITTRVDYALCVNAAFQSAMLDVHYPYPDIVAILSAERLRVAELADKGQISNAEGLARLNDKIADVTRMERSRASPYGKPVDATPPLYFMELMQVGL